MVIKTNLVKEGTYEHQIQKSIGFVIGINNDVFNDISRNSSCC